MIQVLLFRPRRKMSELFRKAQDNSNMNESRVRSKSLEVLETELSAALKAAAIEAKPSFPIANAVGRATLSAAIGLAASVSKGTKQLMEATYEGMEGGDSSTMRRSNLDEDYEA